MVSDSGLHSNVFKALSVRQADLSTVKFANFLPELHTQADTITSNKTFEHWRQRGPTCRKFARAMKRKGKKTPARNLTQKLDRRPLPWTVDRLGAAVRCTQITLIFHRYRFNRDESRRSPTCRKMTGISRDVGPQSLTLRVSFPCICSPPVCIICSVTSLSLATTTWTPEHPFFSTHCYLNASSDITCVLGGGSFPVTAHGFSSKGVAAVRARRLFPSTISGVRAQFPSYLWVEN